MGYSADQLAGLQQTLNRADVDLIISATPIDLAALIEVNKPILRARYEFAELGEPRLTGVVEQFLGRIGRVGSCSS
jgi:predicted GTPase